MQKKIISLICPLLFSSIIEVNANSLEQNRAIFDQIGARIKFFEHKYGPYRNQYGKIKIYEIGDCTFNVLVGQKETIKYIQMPISLKCDINPRNSDLGAISKLRVRDFYYQTMESAFLKPFCVTLCGNAADPTVTFLVNEPHVAMFVSRIITTDLPITLGEIMVKKIGQRRADEGRYNVDDFQETIKSLSANQKISEYGEGYALEKKDIIQ